MVRADRPQDDFLNSLLANHPAVTLNESVSPTGRLVFHQDGWQRQLLWGDQNADVRGLLELVDNNPVVCADTVCIPGPVATLATIALGPVLRAGLVQAGPALHVSETPTEPDDITANLELFGLHHIVTLGIEPQDFGRVVVLNAMVEIPLMDDYTLVDDLFDEAYARSFYIKRINDEVWDTALVDRRPHAAYRLRLTPGEQSALLTVQVMADRHGKLGACQAIHALNIMVGNEECLGIPDQL